MAALSRWHWQIRQALPYLLLVIFVIAVGAVWFLLESRGGASLSSPPSVAKGASTKTTPSLPAPVGNTVSQNPVSQTDKRDALTTLKKFVSAYYGRPVELYVGTPAQTYAKYRHAVAPYATKSFVSNYVRPLDSAADQSLEQQGVIVTASLVKDSLVGTFDSDEKAEAGFVVNFDLERNARTIHAYRAQVNVTLVNDSGVWKVNTLKELD